MLQKGAIYWAVGIGALAAAGAVGAVWHFRSPPQQASVPALSPSPSPGPSAKSAPSERPSQLAVTAPAVPDVAMAAKAEPTQAVAAALPPPAPPQPPQASAADPEPERPQFDIVRIEPSGEAVIAGHAAPKAKVTVTDHGQVVAEADADDSGQFVMLPPTFAPGSHSLGLTARNGEGAPVQSPGIVGIDVPEPPTKAAQGPATPSAAAILAAKSNPPPSPTSPVKVATTQLSRVPASPSVAVAAASRAIEAPPQIAKPPDQSSAAAPALVKTPEPIVVARADASAATATVSPPRIVVTGAAADAAGRLVVTGAAPTGAFLRLYLNGSFLANVTAGADGLWSLTVEHGMKGGAYSIRADEIDKTADAVVERAEVPFNFPEHVAELAVGAKPPMPAAEAKVPTVATPAPQSAAVADPPKVAVAIPAEPKLVANPVPAVPSLVVTPVPATPNPVATPVPAAPKPIAEEASHDTPPPPSLANDAAVASTTPSASIAPQAAPQAPPQQASAERPLSPPSNSAHAIVRTIDTKRVVPGDSLWAISAHIYGNGLRYTQIYAANASQIRNPRLIYPGQIFVLPQPTPF
jgi:nucleoid-associated protein YgaU